MTGYLLDRDVLSALENPRGNKNVHTWIDSIPDHEIYISSITVMEAKKGFVRERAKARSPAKIEEVSSYERDFANLLAAFGDSVLAVDRAVAERWGELLAAREVHIMDTGIAATAAVHGLVVATRNLKDFRDRGVRVIDPFKVNPGIIDS